MNDAQYPDLTKRDFDSAFAEARRRGLDFFVWNGKAYHTHRADGEPMPQARADLCTPTDERVARLVNAVKAMPDDWCCDDDCDPCEELRAALRDMGVET